MGDSSKRRSRAAPSQPSSSPRRGNGRPRERPASSLERVLDELEQPAYVVSSEGSVVIANESARERFPSPPDWLGGLPGAVDPKSFALLAHAVRIRVGQRELWLVLPRTEGIDGAGTRAAQAFLGALPPSLRRVAELLLAGMSEKEIAATSNLAIASVRTYTTRLYRRVGVRSRSELIARAYSLDVG